MTNINDGGSAFPGMQHGINPLNGMPYSYEAPGMTLRDWFAGQAMAAIINKIPAYVGGRQDQHTNETVARGAYNYADAMLAIRQQQES